MNLLQLPRETDLRYERGDYVKVEFDGANGMPAEWMWVRVDHIDEVRRLVFGKLDSEPVLTREVKVGQQIAVSFDKVREHRKPWEFQ